MLESMASADYRKRLGINLQAKEARTVGQVGAKWPGMASMVINIEYMRAVGVRGSTGEIGWAHLIGLTGAYSSMPDVHPCHQDLVEPLSVPSEAGGCDPKKHMRATGLQNHQAWLALAGCECSNHLNRQRSTHLGRLAWMMSNGI